MSPEVPDNTERTEPAVLPPDDRDEPSPPRRSRRSRDDEPDYEREHRAGVILAFGIVGLSMVSCGGLPGLVFAILAWVLGGSDLRAMDEREMDPAGYGMTKSGRICGLVGMILNGLYLLFMVAYIAMIAIVAIGMK